MISYKVFRKTLHFRIPARTSRGAYSEHDMLIVELRDDDGHQGYGECAPLPDLSCDRHAYDDISLVENLVATCVARNNINDGNITVNNVADSIPSDMPALRFAVESAFADMTRDSSLYDTPFARGEADIPINGLVWMADYDNMLAQLKTKIEQGFSCVKLKIGAIDWQQELNLLHYIRSQFDETMLQIRVDANGAFTADNVYERLNTLSGYGIHSIEQPIKAAWQMNEGEDYWHIMAELCRNTPIPIALDEELIGINDISTKRRMLDTVCPQYIVIKPTLHGGISGTHEWITEARLRGIGSWITSALESNIGLRSVALLSAREYGAGNTFPQGLGTGLLFTDNLNTGEMEIRNGKLHINTIMDCITY